MTEQRHSDPVPSTSRGPEAPHSAAAAVPGKKREAADGDEDVGGNGGYGDNKVARKQENVQEDTIPVDRSFLDMLECPVCLELVRIGRPVYSCSNGHIVCNACHGAIRGVCPSCRDKSITINRCVERLAARALRNVVIGCNFAYRGCAIRQPMPAMDGHESACLYRDFPCVGLYWKGCAWVGTIYQIKAHKDQSSCFECAVWDDVVGGRHTFSGRVSGSRCLRKPVLILSRTRDGAVSHRFLLYWLVSRNERRGTWRVFVRSFAPKDLNRDARVAIEITGYGVPSHFKYTYGGIVHPVSPDEKNNAVRLDRALVLTDEQVVGLSSGDTLFRYKITLDLPEAAGA